MVSLRTGDADGTSRLRPTAIGAAAVVMWSTLALLTTLTGSVLPGVSCFCVARLLKAESYRRPQRECYRDIGQLCFRAVVF